MLPTVVRVHPVVPVNSRTCFQFFISSLMSRVIGALRHRGRSGVCQCEYRHHLRPDRVQYAHGFACGGAGGDDVVDEQHFPDTGLTTLTRPAMFRCRSALDRPTESATKARVRRAATTLTPRESGHRGLGHPRHRVAAAASGRPPAGRRRHDRDRRCRQGPSSTAGQARPAARSASGTIRSARPCSLTATMRFAPRARIAAQREDGHARDQRAGRSGAVRRADGELSGAGTAPPRRRSTAASAFQRQHQIEHAPQCRGAQ